MATKNYLDLTGLQKYDELIKEYIGTEDAKSIKSLTRVGNTVNFFKTADASGTAAYTVDIPDVSGFMDKIASATGSKVVASTSAGQVVESSLSVSDVATKNYADTAAQTAADGKDEAIAAAKKAGDDAQSDVDALEQLVGELPDGATATTVVGYAEEVADAVAGDLQALDQSLATVAKSGSSADVSYDNTTSGLTSTNVKAAIDELAEASAGGVASKTIYLADESAGQSAYAKVYGIYQGSDSSDMTKNVSVGKINIPLDKVVKSASLVTEDDQGNEGYFLKLEFQNDAGIVYVDLTVLADVYSGVTGSEVAVTVDGYNISASIVEVNGSKLTAESVAKGKLATAVQASLDLADSAVQSVAEGATNGTIDVDGTEVSVHGLGSAAYTASTAYDASGAAATAKTEVIGTSADTATSDTIYGAKAYADAATASIATADIQALFA